MCTDSKTRCIYRIIDDQLIDACFWENIYTKTYLDFKTKLDLPADNLLSQVVAFTEVL